VSASCTLLRGLGSDRGRRLCACGWWSRSPALALPPLLNACSEGRVSGLTRANDDAAAATAEEGPPADSADVAAAEDEAPGGDDKIVEEGGEVESAYGCRREGKRRGWRIDDVGCFCCCFCCCMPGRSEALAEDVEVNEERGERES